MNPIDRLTELFEKFPGIGPRQARRFVQYLLSTQPSTRTELAGLVGRIGEETAQCKKCFRWFLSNRSSGKKAHVCDICASPARDQSTLFVVEKDADIEQVDRSGYRGLYFVLGGTIPLAAEDTHKHVHLRELVKRVEEDAAQKKSKEIILGLSATTEGDHTRLIVQEKLLPIAEGFKLKLTSLGRGLSTGSELEYADPDTIASAFNSRI